MRRRGWKGLREKVKRRLAKMVRVEQELHCPICRWVRAHLVPNPETIDLSSWFRGYRPDKKMLAAFRARHWPAWAPTFTILLPVVAPTCEWLEQALGSVRAQTYARWNLLCFVNGPVEERVQNLLRRLRQPAERVIDLQTGAGEHPSDFWNTVLAQARGDYVCVLHENDALEPHALYRFAEAVLADRPDLLYSDEVTTGADLDQIRSVAARPQFSYDYYLAHAFFTNLLGVRTSLLRAAGVCPADLLGPQPVSAVLRVLEKARTVCHVPDILYRCRTPAPATREARQDLDRQAERAVQEHLRRRGWQATVETVVPGIRKLTFSAAPAARVAILIPTRNQVAHLRACLESLRQTVPGNLADVHILNHRSDDPETLSYLHALPAAYRVLDCDGPFNFSVLMNQGVRSLGRPYSHFLFLNNDTEAMTSGWLEHMLGLASRPNVGIVGALLLYADRSVQHGGVLVGLNGGADHLNRFRAAFTSTVGRAEGVAGSLLCTRDNAAVTGACMLMRAEVFDRVGGFDERLAVGFGDTDLCLRVRQAGYQVLFDPHAVLVHHESSTRGRTIGDPHPADTRLFMDRYAELIRAGDPCHSPLWSKNEGLEFTLIPGLHASPWLLARTVDINQTPEAKPEDAGVLMMPARAAIDRKAA